MNPLIEEYQNFVAMDRNYGERDLYIMSVGLGEEAGEVLGWLKKQARDGDRVLRDLELELGDTLYYLTKIADYHGFSLEEIMESNMDKVRTRRVQKLLKKESPWDENSSS